MKSSSPLISVCIPLFESERFLHQALMSVLLQDTDDFEVVIVNDASNGKDDQGHKAKKIVAMAQKEAVKKRMLAGQKAVAVKYVEHSENRGLVEARRTLLYESRGRYITMLDSDDVMEEGALRAFIENLPGHDIVHGTSTAGTFDSDGNFTPAKENRYGAIHYGPLQGRDIFHTWLVKEEFTANTWGKLIKRELFEKAYENIPYTECNLGEDLLLFFFISRYAKSYIGIKDKVVKYRINSGMTSKRQITSLKQWKMIGSTSSVFNILSTWIKEAAGAESQAQSQSPETQSAEAPQSEAPLLPEEIDYIRKLTVYYLENNIHQLREAVVPELQEQAHKMLCEYWGESFVNRVEEALQKK